MKKNTEKKFFIKNKAGKFLAGSKRIMDKKTGITEYKKVFTDDYQEAKLYTPRTAKEYVRKNKGFFKVDPDEVTPATMEQINSIPDMPVESEKVYIINPAQGKFFSSLGDGMVDIDEAEMIEKELAIDICTKSLLSDELEQLLIVEEEMYKDMVRNPDRFEASLEAYKNSDGQCVCGECDLPEDDDCEELIGEVAAKESFWLKARNVFINIAIVLWSIMMFIWFGGFIIGLFN